MLRVHSTSTSALNYLKAYTQILTFSFPPKTACNVQIRKNWLRLLIRDKTSLEPQQLVPPRPLELAGDHLPQDEGGAHEDAPDEKQEGKGHRVETQLLGGRDGEVLEALVATGNFFG